MVVNVPYLCVFLLKENHILSWLVGRGVTFVTKTQRKRVKGLGHQLGVQNSKDRESVVEVPSRTRIEEHRGRRDNLFIREIIG